MSSSGVKLDPTLVSGALEEAVPAVVTEFFDGKVILRDDDTDKVPESDLPDRLSGPALVATIVAATATLDGGAP